jgi:hypothetical protein
MNTSTEWQQYRQMRETGMQLRTEIMGLLPMNYLEKCARDLGLMQDGKLQIQNYLQLLLLEDFALFNYGPTGIIAIQKYQHIRQANFTPVQAQYIEALLKSRLSVFHVTNSVPNLGVNVRDLLYGDTLFIVDERVQQGQCEGAVFSCRPLLFPGFSMILGSLHSLSDRFLELLPYHVELASKLKDRPSIRNFEQNLIFSILYDSLQSDLDIVED